MIIFQMKKIFTKSITKLFGALGYSLIRVDSMKKYNNLIPQVEEFNFIKYYPFNASNYLKYNELSPAQLKQDLFVLMELDFKRNGFFVEFGATDGISLSNTYLLEKEFGWQGILAEPGKVWHEKLFKNRGVSIEKSCIWSSSGEELIFKEVKMASLSTLQGFGEDDNHSKSRTDAINYKVNTLSLLDFLTKYNAPPIIDYISIDTEGSELEILKNFDFKKFKFRVMTIEHNYMPIRKEIYKLLTSNGYKRIHEEFSHFDDWYILNEE